MSCVHLVAPLWGALGAVSGSNSETTCCTNGGLCRWNGVPQSQCEGQYGAPAPCAAVATLSKAWSQPVLPYAGCCYDPAASSIGNGGATEALPACFTYNTGSSSYSFAAASNGANSGAAQRVQVSLPSSIVHVCMRMQWH